MGFYVDTVMSVVNPRSVTHLISRCVAFLDILLCSVFLGRHVVLRRSHSSFLRLFTVG